MPKRIKERDPGIPSTKVTNEIARELNERLEGQGAPDGYGGENYSNFSQFPIWGIVVANGPDGEADFKTHRYWIKFAYGDYHATPAAEGDPAETEATPETDIKLAGLPEDHPDYLIVAAVNLGERKELHTLPMGTPVALFLIDDYSLPESQRWAFHARAPESFWGEVTCYGPNGEPQFTDNRYWVREARITNPSGDADNARITFAPNENGLWIVATHLFEDYGGHEVKPGTPVRVFQDYVNDKWRHVMLVADIQDSGLKQDCYVCLHKYRCSYDCATEEPGEVEYVESSCGPAPDNAGSWYVYETGCDAATCTMEIIVVGDACDSPGDCPEPEEAPDPPEAEEFEGCCARCIHHIKITYDCSAEAGEEWGEFEELGVTCRCADEHDDDVWLYGGRIGCVVTFEMYYVGDRCADAEDCDPLSPGILDAIEKPEVTDECPRCVWHFSTTYVCPTGDPMDEEEYVEGHFEDISVAGANCGDISDENLANAGTWIKNGLQYDYYMLGDPCCDGTDCEGEEPEPPDLPDEPDDCEQGCVVPCPPEAGMYLRSTGPGTMEWVSPNVNCPPPEV